MKEFFTIGEVSRLFNINRKTLRFYDEIDLFKPSYVNESNNYRYYSIDQFECLETIQYLKELGLTLSKIKYHLNNLNLDSIIDSLEYQNQIIEEKILGLQNMKKNVNKKIKQIQDATQGDLLDKVREIEIDQRNIVEYREKASYENVALLIRKLAQASSYKVYLTYGEVGVTISKENLEKEFYTDYESAFIIVDDIDGIDDILEKDLIKVIPKSKHISIRYNGSRKEAPKYYEKLIKYINENNYEINGESIEIQLVDPSLITCKEEMVTEIQIPVRRKNDD